MPRPISELPDPQVVPAPALEKRTRRRFSTEYKLRILAQADACAYGELSALLRRESLYSNQLQQWRREFAQHGAQGLSKSAPGPAPSKTPEQRRIEALEKELARVSHKLELAEDCLELQKKLASMLERTSNGDDA